MHNKLMNCFVWRVVIVLVVCVCSVAAEAASPSWLTAHDVEIKTLLGQMTLGVVGVRPECR